MILAILAMTAVCSITMLSTMTTIKSLNRTFAIEALQNNARQALSGKHNETVARYQINPVVNNIAITTPINFNNIDYNFHLYPMIVRVLNLPPLGYSINSNFSTQYIQFKSQVANDVIQTPYLVTGFSCLKTNSNVLTNIAQKHYLLDDYFISPVGYVFDSETGMIWKKTNTDIRLFMDMNFDEYDVFSRADFAMISTENSAKLQIAFAVTQNQHKKNDATNILYIVFDEFISTETVISQGSTGDLIKLTNKYVQSGNEKGYLLPLTPGKLHISAITTIQQKIIFITQQLSLDQQTDKPVFENLLYQINLLPTQKPILNISRLPSTTYILDMATQQIGLTHISLQNQIDQKLVNHELHCHRRYQYEQ